MNKKQQIEELQYQNMILKEELTKQKSDQKIVLVPPTKACKKLKPEDLFVYMIKLSEPASFSDTEKHKFERFVLITRRPFEEEFNFSEMPLYFEDVDIMLNGQASASWFVILDWVTNDIPIIMSVFTEKDCEEFLDAQIDANAIKNIKEKALTRMYFNSRSFLKRFDLEIEELEAWNEMNIQKHETTIQQIENELAQKGDDPFSDIQTGIKLSKGWFVGLASGWIIALGLLIALLV